MSVNNFSGQLHLNLINLQSDQFCCITEFINGARVGDIYVVFLNLIMEIHIF